MTKRQTSIILRESLEKRSQHKSLLNPNNDTNEAVGIEVASKIIKFKQCEHNTILGELGSVTVFQAKSFVSG